MLKYLTDSFHKGNSYGTLNTYRSAVSLTSPDNIGQDSLISRFLKGVFRLKPTVTSSALLKGVDLSTIRRTAGWSKNSEIFAKFYNRPIIKENTFLSTVLKS